MGGAECSEGEPARSDDNIAPPTAAAPRRTLNSRREIGWTLVPCASFDSAVIDALS
jgi:hypothetical protein